MWMNTFSITARSKTTNEYGVAVATAVPAVGALVPHASLHGAIATQSYTNFGLGMVALRLLEVGIPLQISLRLLLESDEQRTVRQVVAIDDQGSMFAHTGQQCVPWAGHKVGDTFIVAGNMLVGPDTLDAMSDEYEARHQDDLPMRLLAALASGQRSGGDKRGKRSAALLIASPQPAFYHNLRVDDHPEAVVELTRIYHAVREGAQERVDRYRRFNTPIQVKW